MFDGREESFLKLINVVHKRMKGCEKKTFGCAIN